MSETLIAWWERHEGHSGSTKWLVEVRDLDLWEWRYEDGEMQGKGATLVYGKLKPVYLSPCGWVE